MTIGQWIKEYCEENSIEMPTGIDDYTTQLDFLILNDDLAKLRPIAKKSFEVNTSSTTASNVGSIVLHDAQLGDVYLIVTEDSEGIREGYFYKSTNVCCVYNDDATLSTNFYTMRGNSSGGVNVSVNSGGVYASKGYFDEDGLELTISAKYGASVSATIDSTYVTKVYKIKLG